MKLKEIIFVLALVLGMLGTTTATGNWGLFFVFLIFFLCFGAVEAIAVKWKGKSISQQFWAYAKQHKVGAWIVLGGMFVAWMALLFHLAEGLWR